MEPRVLRSRYSPIVVGGGGGVQRGFFCFGSRRSLAPPPPGSEKGWINDDFLSRGLAMLPKVHADPEYLKF